MKKGQHAGRQGYIAITSILIILAVVLIIGTSVSLLSVNDIQSSLSSEKGEQALSLAEACAEDALLRLNNNNAIPASFTIPEGTCTITGITNIGNNWTFTANAVILNYSKSVQVSAVRTTTVQVTSWIEI